MLKDALACVGKYSSRIKALFASSESEASNTFERKCSTIYRDCLYSDWSVILLHMSNHVDLRMT